MKYLKIKSSFSVLVTNVWYWSNDTILFFQKNILQATT